MRLELVTHTTDIEAMIAIAVLTTTSKSKPSALFRRLKKDPERVANILGRIEVQHDSVLDHKRLCWRIEATDAEVLDVLLRNRFFFFTRLDGYDWLLSSNLRTTIRYIQEYQGDSFSEALRGSIPYSLVAVLDKIGGNVR